MVSKGLPFTRDMVMWVACTVMEGHVMVATWPGVLPRTMSGTVVLLQPGSVLMFLVHAATRVHLDTWGLGPNL